MITDFQLLIGLCLTIAVICIYLIWFRPKDLDIDFAIPATLVVTPFISLVIGFVIFFNIRFIDTDATVVYKSIYSIVSLKNNDVTNGNFMLGFGSIKQSEYYFYFYKTRNGGYARGKKNVDETVIIEDNSAIPHIEILTTTYKSKSGWFKFGEQTEEEYKIIVPKGTILNKFELY